MGVNGENKYIGCYNSEKLAAVAYNVAALMYYGIDAKLNDV